MSNNVNHPSHYTQGDIECIDALKAATVGKKGIEAVCVANVIKYLFRYEAKNGLEDVKKAQWYINRLIQELEDNDTQEQPITHKSTLDEKYPVFNGDENLLNINCAECKYFENLSVQLPCNACKWGAFPSNYRPLRFSPKDT